MRVSTRSTGFAILSLALPCWPQEFHADIPRAWDDKAVEALEVPLAQRDRSPRNLSAEEYYKLKVQPIYRSYPVYVKGREPAGYLESLKQKEPEIIFDPAKLHTKEDWVAAGKLVFESDTGFRPAPSEPPTENDVGFPASKDGIVAVARYYVRRKGVLERGNNACAGCHTRVMPDGSLWEGAQGAAFVPVNQLLRVQHASSDQFRQILNFHWISYGTPWAMSREQFEAYYTKEELVRELELIRQHPRVLFRQGTSLVRRQLFLRIDDDYFSGSTTITL